MSLIQQKPKFVEVTTDSEVLRSQLNEALVGRDLVKINDIEYVCFSGDGFNRFSLSEFRRVRASSPEKAEWTGEGLPPVGTVCELRVKGYGDWSSAQIMYMSESGCLWVPYGAQSESFNASYNMEFRPIRTPEQIAAEERESGIVEMCELFMRNKVDAIRVIDCCERLYDAGCRMPGKGAKA